NCKWGNETLNWTRKMGSRGGKIDIYLDGVKLDSFNTYNKTSKTESIVIAKNLEKGEHTFKAIFRGSQSGVDYKNKPA
ncbi:peptidase, partial [Staphylococcus aureus]|nr:peptidase [Staphylococcus aureus]